MKRWLGVRGAVAGAVLALTAGPAAGADPGPMTAGTIELGIAGGYSFSHNSFFSDKKGLEAVHAYHGLINLGGVVTDEHGPPLLRGNLEVLLEPTYIHLDTTPEADTFGLALMFRWLWSGNYWVRPYLELGGGVLGGRIDLRQTHCDLNFLLEGGPGLMFFLNEHAALSIGYRFHHISNGGKCSPNLGINSSLILAGVSYFFH